MAGAGLAGLLVAAAAAGAASPPTSSSGRIVMGTARSSPGILPRKSAREHKRKMGSLTAKYAKYAEGEMKK